MDDGLAHATGRTPYVPSLDRGRVLAIAWAIDTQLAKRRG